MSDNNSIEKLILGTILHVPDLSAKFLSVTKPEYFENLAIGELASLINNYYKEYNDIPSKETLEVEVEQKNGISSDTYKNAKTILNQLNGDEIKSSILNLDRDWITNTTEQYYISQACQIAVLESINILDGENKKLKKENIPGILETAVSISIDNEVGHDYFEDAESRFEYYHRTDAKIPFKLSALNEITNGGAGEKSLIVPVAPTGVGKTLYMTDWASFLIQEGYDVLYITLEMPEEKIAQRIDANLMNMQISDLEICPKENFNNAIDKLKSKTVGRLVIKEYPSSSFTALTLKSLLKELKVKKNFKPKIIMVDYLNLVTSYNIGKSIDSYASVKAASEELRSLALEGGYIICSPTQTNREGQDSEEFTMKEISESIGLAFTADMIFGMTQTEEMAKQSLMRIKQLKNRWGDLFNPNSFLVSTNKGKMQLSDYDDITKMTQKSKLSLNVENNNSKSKQKNGLLDIKF